MKYSKTTLRELSAKYRSVLKKCFLLNAMAMGLIVATNASAAINVQTGTTDISADVITTIVANANLDKAAEAPAVPDPDGQLNKYTFTKADGFAADGNDFGSISAASYQGIASSADGTTVARSTTLGYDSGTLAETDYQYKDGQGAWTTYGSGAKTFTDTYTLGEYAGYTELTLTGVNGGKTYDLDGTQYQFAVGTTQYTLNADATKVIKVSDSSETDISALSPGDLLTAATAAQTEYGNAKIAIQAKQDVIDGYATTEAANYAAAGSTLTADQTTVNNLQTYEASYEAAKSQYDTDAGAYGDYVAYTKYNNSLSQAMDNKITKVIGDVEGGYNTTTGTHLTAYDGTPATDVVANMNALDNAIITLEGDENTSGSVAYAVKQLADGAVADNASAIAENTDAITTLNGDANTDGSVAKALADAKAYTDTLENGAVADNASAIATLNGDEETSGSVAYAVKQLADGAVADNASAIATLNGDEETSGSVAYAVKQLADGAVADNASAIAALNGDENTSGSVAYAIAQEASARDTAIATATTMGATDGKNYTAGSSVIAAIESIDTNMGKIHGLIGSDGSFNGTATSTNMDGTTYKGNLAVGTTVEDHLVALDNTIGIMSNLTTTEKTTVVGAINEVDAKIGTTADGTYVAAANTVGQNLNALDSALGDVRSDMASTQVANNARFAQIDRRIDKLEDKMEKGLAANNALAGLVPLDHTHKTQLSAAVGGYGSNQALAVGAFHYINDSTLLNAGVGYGGNSSMSYKVGVTFGF